ncbi:hypothetical protein [Saccharothrix sp. Mg75]|uniref:hypothetical protein n=1 Tax=Saccharothrix sp. Mg75 TaxID=3445357 RepID=UPI003EEBE7CC
MPPSRRRPVPSTPTGGRPRVAGLRKRTEPAAERPEPVEPAGHVEHPEPAGHVEPTGRPADDAVTEAARPGVEPTEAESAGVEPADRVEEGSPRVLGLIEPREDADETDGSTGETPGTGEDADEAPAPSPRPRPSGRRRRAGEAVAASVLDDDHEPRPVRRTARAGLVLPVSLLVLAALLVGLGAWFQARAGAVDHDLALVDSARTSEVAGQAREAVEKAFSYDFADVAATENAANELLVGRAKCQYNAIFGPVRTLAPEQKLVVTVKAVSSGVTSLSGDRATVLLFVDQVTTRTTDNQSGGGIAMMRVGAQEVDGRWKVDNMEMFGQSGDQAAETAKC